MGERATGPTEPSQQARTRARVRGEEGNTLALFPAAVLVMFVLASIAIDAALTFSAQRQLQDIAAAAANDAATAFQDEAYFDSGEIRLDPVRAQQRVDDTLARRSDADRLGAGCTASIADGQVVVDCRGAVQQLISPARFLGVGSRDIAATGSARPVQG